MFMCPLIEQVEASFLACTACGTLAHSTDVCVARCKKAEIFPNESPIDSRYVDVRIDLNNDRQQHINHSFNQGYI